LFIVTKTLIITIWSELKVLDLEYFIIPHLTV